MNIYWSLGLLIAFIAYSGTIYYMADRAGANSVQVACEVDKLILQQAAIAQTQKIENDAAAKATVYEQEAAQLRNDNQQLMGRLKNVLQQNGALRACVATNDFLQIYNNITAPTIH